MRRRRRSHEPMEVTIAAHTAGGVGGMELVLTELLAGLLDRGWRVTLVSRTCELPPRPGFRWVRVRVPGRPFALAYPLFFLVGSLLLWRVKRGVVHTTGAIVFNRADLSTVHLCHLAVAQQPGLRRSRRSTPLYRLNEAVGSLMSRLAERCCYRPVITRQLAAVSGGVGRELVEHFPAMRSRVETIPNGVDPGLFKPDSRNRADVRTSLGLGSEELVALFVGGEWERKGLRYAIESLSHAPSWRLLVAGSGDTTRFQAVAERAGVGERVRFTGATQDVAGLYQAADAFVLPTAYETFSLVTYEAAASGLPVLVSRVSGVEDILRDGENGWYITRDPVVIATRLNALAADPGTRAAMGLSARKSIDGFGWSFVVDEYEHLYRRLAADGLATPAVPVLQTRDT